MRVAGQLGAPDVLVHADARDLVERPVGDLAVVLDPDLNAVPEAGLRDAGPGELRLRLGQRDAHRGHPELRGGVDRQRAPAAADVQQPFALVQPQLAADHVKLALLRSLQRVVGAGEVGTRVGHGRSEYEAEKRLDTSYWWRTRPPQPGTVGR